MNKNYFRNGQRGPLLVFQKSDYREKLEMTKRKREGEG